MFNFISLAVGTWAIILVLKFSIDQCKKLGMFLKIINSNDKKKHSGKIMFLSLIKYLVFLIALITCTYEIFAACLIPLWLVVLYLTWYYIKLWKYQGYSVIILIVAVLSVGTVTFAVSGFIRQFIMFLTQNWGTLITTVLGLAVIAYHIFSKFDSKYKLYADEEAKKAVMFKFFR